MSFIFFLLFLLLFIGLGIFAWIYRIVAGIRRGVSGIFNSGGRDSSPRGGNAYRSTEDTGMRRRGKRIDPTQGEYVEFEEIACDVDRVGDHNPPNVYTEVEEQVTDAEWEEIGK